MEEEFRDHIATVSEDGKRVWVYPKKPKGKFTNRRKWVSYSLLIFLLTAPFIKINGDQLIELNILERKFSIFGATFWPQDLYLFAVMLIIFIVLVCLPQDRILDRWRLDTTKSTGQTSLECKEMGKTHFETHYFLAHFFRDCQYFPDLYYWK